MLGNNSGNPSKLFGTDKDGGGEKLVNSKTGLVCIVLEIGDKLHGWNGRRIGIRPFYNKSMRAILIRVY